MLDIAETRASLEGAIRLALGRADGMAGFGRDMDAFWRSFAAILVAAPAYLAHVWAEHVLLAAADQAPSFAHLALVRLVYYPVDWLAFPVVFIVLSQLLGISQHYGAYIIAFNWTSVVVVAAITLPTILYAAGILPETLAGIMSLVILLAALRLRWLIARLALGVDALTAGGLVFVEFALGLLVARAFSAML